MALDYSLGDLWSRNVLGCDDDLRSEKVGLSMKTKGKQKINWLSIEDDYVDMSIGAFIEKYFANHASKEFYFGIEDDEDSNLRNVWFCPIQFIKKHKRFPDCPLYLQNDLPKYLKNPFADAFWYSGKSKADIEADLIALGFIKNDKMIDW